MQKSNWLVAVLLALSWLGLFSHNSIENVDSSSGIMGIVAAILFIGWSIVPLKRVAASLLIFLGLLHLAGAIITVIPFSFLPFAPPQNLTHYFAHLIYGLAQLPLIAVMIRRARHLR